MRDATGIRNERYEDLVRGDESDKVKPQGEMSLFVSIYGPGEASCLNWDGKKCERHAFSFETSSSGPLSTGRVETLVMQFALLHTSFDSRLRHNGRFIEAFDLRGT